MPKSYEWTNEQDDTIKLMRLHNASWDSIANAIGVSRWSASERGRKIGAVLGLVEKATVDDTREPLPPGHAATWGAIIADTSLAGASYPYPVFS